MRASTQRRRFRIVIPKYPAFNVYSHIAKKTTALGPLCVATTVNKTPIWDVEVIDENNYRFPGPVDRHGMPDHQELQKMRPADVVGFYGGLSCTIPRLQQVARLYQEQGVFTVGGGQHLDFLSEEGLRNGLDVVVHGEGERTICELLQAWENGEEPAEGPWAERLDEIQGISFLRDGTPVTTDPRPPINDFESLPLPDFGLLRFAKVRVYPISRIRGCGMNCEFCSVKGRARCATPERLMAQITYLSESRGAREFFVVDDQFAQDRDETLRFCKMLRDYQSRLHLRFFITIQVRLDVAKDEELLAAMQACRIRCLAIGFESVIDEELRAMGKHLEVDEMLDLAKVYRRHGFMIHGMFIFGYPMRPGMQFRMSASERAKRLRRFISKARLDTIQVLLPVPLPGTALRERLAKEGRVFPTSAIGWEYYDGNFPLIWPDAPMTAEEMQQSIVKLMHGFYRFGHLAAVGLRTLQFPLAMLPLVNLKARWRRWYRCWRNEVIGSVGWFIVRGWRKKFATGQFREKLSKLNATARNSPPP